MKIVRTPKIFLPVFIIAGMMSVILACVSSGTPSANKAPTPTATRENVKVNTELSFQEIETQYDSLNDDDFDAYIEGLRGTRIHWIGKVTGGDKETLIMDVGQKTFRSVLGQPTAWSPMPAHRGRIARWPSPRADRRRSAHARSIQPAPSDVR